MKEILGIDVGMSGALSFYNGKSLETYDMPTVKRNKTNRIDAIQLFEIINSHAVDHAFIEQVNAFNMGRTSAYNFGYGCGVIEGIICALKIPHTFITPQQWKKAMSCPRDKDGARARASQLLPEHAHIWPLKKHDGRAESALIALYGFQNT